MAESATLCQFLLFPQSQWNKAHTLLVWHTELIYNLIKPRKANISSAVLALWHNRGKIPEPTRCDLLQVFRKHTLDSEKKILLEVDLKYFAFDTKSHMFPRPRSRRTMIKLDGIWIWRPGGREGGRKRKSEGEREVGRKGGREGGHTSGCWQGWKDPEKKVRL